jgi:hypothetical protein
MYIYDRNYSARIDVEVICNEHNDPLSCSIIVDGGEGEPAVSIQLGPDNVSELRRALQRIEHRFKTQERSRGLPDL